MQQERENMTVDRELEREREGDKSLKNYSKRKLK
jgi:hypothetical protein